MRQPKICFSPLKHWETACLVKDIRRGEALTKKGKVATLILAGGLGTRLHSKKPKGCFLIENKSLFERHFTRILLLQKKIKHTLEVGILVSSFTKKETLSFLKKHRFFGLKSSQVTFIEQKNLPSLDQRKRVVSETPNGNGGFYEALLCSGTLESWMNKGIEFVHLIAVDNPLADPFEVSLTGAVARKKADSGLLMFKRENTALKTGIVVTEKRKIIVKEYTDLPQEILDTRDPNKQLYYSFGNVGHLIFRLSFLKRLASQKNPLPSHQFLKKTYLGTKKRMLWITELFAQDLLAYSRSTVALLVSKETSFAPLKCLRGAGGLNEVKRALSRK